MTIGRKEIRRMRRLNKAKRALFDAKQLRVKAELRLQRAYRRYVEVFSKEWC